MSTDSRTDVKKDKKQKAWLQAYPLSGQTQIMHALNDADYSIIFPVIFRKKG